MKLLLDTHVFLWYISADPQLPIAYRDAIRDPAKEVYLNRNCPCPKSCIHCAG